MASDNRQSESDGCLIWIVAGFALFAACDTYRELCELKNQLVAAGVISELAEQSDAAP